MLWINTLMNTVEQMILKHLLALRLSKAIKIT